MALIVGGIEVLKVLEMLEMPEVMRCGLFWMLEAGGVDFVTGRCWR